MDRRLAILAASRSTTIGRLVTEFAESTLTDGELAERVEATRQVVRESTGISVTPKTKQQSATSSREP